MKKYIVYITYYSGIRLPQFYIGSSYEEKVLNGYNGTVKSKKYKEIYKEEQIKNKQLFKTRILSYHATTQKALKEELRLQKKHRVVKNNKYFNESYAQPNGFFGRDIKKELHPMYGKTHRKESMLQMVETSKNDIDKEGLNLLQRKAIKGANSMSIKKENGLSIRDEALIKRADTIARNGKHYNIFDYNNKIIHMNIEKREAKLIHSKIIEYTKDKKMGYDNNHKASLNRINKLNLIGYYSEEIT